MIRWWMATFLAAVWMASGGGAVASAQQSGGEAGWAQQQLIEPAELVTKLHGPLRDRPAILQVGFHLLYDGAHIPGAIYAGPASAREGLELLRKTAARISRDRAVVIYCGCCPMDKCPNVRPAYDTLVKLGFRNLRVLDLPQDFDHDWVQKGYPVVRAGGGKQ
jgi:thiosulfate/3-mercaptopyruvate sulfurtransferase